MCQKRVSAFQHCSHFPAKNRTTQHSCEFRALRRFSHFSTGVHLHLKLIYQVRPARTPRSRLQFPPIKAPPRRQRRWASCFERGLPKADASGAPSKWVSFTVEKLVGQSCHENMLDWIFWSVFLNFQKAFQDWYILKNISRILLIIFLNVRYLGSWEAIMAYMTFSVKKIL